MTAETGAYVALARLLLPFLLALAAAVSCAAAGRIALGRGSSISESLLVGYPIFGTICFLIALGGTSRWYFVALLIAGMAAGARLLRPEIRGAGIPLPAAILMAICAILALLLAQLPAVSLDEVAYHLAVPKIWLMEGRAIDLSLISHSYFPFGIESAALPLLALLGDRGAIAAHLLHAISATATGLLFFAALRRRVSTGAAAYGTLALISTPALLATAGFAWNDWPLVGIGAVLFMSLEEGNRRGTAVALAAGLLTKYTFAPLALLLIVASRRWPRWEVLAGGIAGSVYFIRNVLLTGSPIAPFLTDDAPAVAGFRIGGLASYVLDPRFVDEALGLALLVACAGVASASAGFRRLAGLLAALGGALLLLLQPSSRILVPFLAIVAIAGAHILERRTARVAVAVLAALQIVLVALYTASLHPLPLLAGRISEADYLRNHRISFSGIEAVNAALPDGSRTLVVGMNELFWFSHRVRGGGNFDGPRVNGYLEAPDLRQKLQEEGITHLAFFFPREVSGDRRKTEERATRLSPRALENIRALPGVRSAVAPGVALVELRP
jgi:hypothetical protein